MATEVKRRRAADRAVLRGVGWRTYLDLRYKTRNGHLRMSYLDGTLILMSPQYIHDRYGWRLALVVDRVTEALRIPCQGTGTTPLGRKGRGARQGGGKEPDYGFYFGENEARMRAKEVIDLEVDPPPDLAIEVDHKADSSRALRIYARLGVPEVWRYRVKSRALWFGRLDGDGYRPLDRSLNIPRLTPALVLQALAEADRLGEPDWKPWLRDWARDLPEVPPTA